MSKFSVPTHHDHKPIFVVRDYNEIDGQYAPDTTDAQHLSLGVSQWSNDDLSLKVFRHTGKRWSRQSEELPLHRPIDLTLLLCAVILHRKAGIKPPCVVNNNDFEMIVDLIPEGQQQLENLDTFLSEHWDVFIPRLCALSNLLDNMKNEGIL